MNDWPALHRWTQTYLKKAFKGQHTIAGDYSMIFDNFLAYSQRSHDEMPLYLFDKHFANKAPQLAADFKVGLGPCCLSMTNHTRTRPLQKLVLKANFLTTVCVVESLPTCGPCITL